MAEVTETKRHPSEALIFPLTPLTACRHASITSEASIWGPFSSPPEMPPAGREVKAATQSEHRMTFRRGVRLYPKAIGWSVLLSLAIVMEGFDTTLINTFFAFPEFQGRFGIRASNGSYQITTAWQSALTNGATIGDIIGLFANGILIEKLGHRKTMILALLALAIFVFLQFFAYNMAILMASEVLCGLAWGVFQTLTTTYAAEVMPLALRAYLTSNVNLCWLLGQITAFGVLRAMLKYNSEWSYRVPFGLQWVWIVFILAGVIFAPESPWWLVKHERLDDAKRTLLRLTRNESDFNADNTVALMVRTNEIEKEMATGLSYLDCFKGTDLRRTEIVCMVWMTQVLCGLPMQGYATYFYVQAGFAPDRAFDLSVGTIGLGIIGQLLSWGFLRIFGRRTLYICGCSVLFIILMTAGGVATRPDSAATSWTVGSLMILFTFVFDSAVGPVCYSLVAEIPSTRLRVKTVILARVAYNIVLIPVNVLMPKMLNPMSWDWKGKTCFFWAGTCFLCIMWCYFRLPEPKGLTFMELDILFEKKASARKFSRFQRTLASTGYFNFHSAAEEQDRWP